MDEPKAALLYPRATASRQVVSLDGLWRFRLDPKGEGRARQWQQSLGSRELIPVPASFQDFFTDKEIREYTGDFWYETEAFIPGEWRGKRIALRFDGAAHRAFLFVNGREAAFHEGGFLPFAADITALAKWGESNRVSVLVNNELSEKTLPVGRTETLPGGGKIAKPYFDFFNYSGLQRSVRLLALPETAITDFSVIHRLVGDDAEVDYGAEASGEGEVRLRVYDEKGNECAAAAGKRGTIRIPRARRWNVRDAYLYRFVIRLYKDGALADEWYDDIGIRTVEVKGSAILVNGRSVYLKGFGKHEDSDFFGRGYNPAAWKRDFELLKWTGANSFRTSHYP
ncbi:MAG: hypothetical protein LBC88_05600, partial [Spirochaetaceae bacterium]|nr:hypothetical protein [Spirochaetaceae bacterium]